MYMIAKSKKAKKTSAAPIAEVLPLAEPAEIPAGFPVVGIGASAGGLAAFEAFFCGIPAGINTGMAFVLVQHLAPAHKSILAELVGRYTGMRVSEARDGQKVQPDCVYVIPPNRDMTFENGELRLFETGKPGGPRLPIDRFFSSLAQAQGERAVCIVLSGTGSDGTLGARAVKGEGGLVLAQTPETAEYDGMPRSAIAAGLPDFVLPPAEMPAQLLAYMGQAFPGRVLAAAPEGRGAAELMKTIFSLLRARTGNDFSLYKPNTVTRRIERRMAIRQIAALGAYVQYLQKNLPEQDALFSDLLIGVTRFFRDPKEYKALEEAVAGQLSAVKPEGYTVRAWVPACSTGEEAYSLAILLAEQMEKLKPGLQAQIFATDIDRRAIETARAGVYPAGIAGDITPERLARFFTAEPGGTGYRVNKNIRGMLVFSEQNAIKDPPFSKLDLVSCRNLLIYLGGEVQEKLLPLFHYALNPGGLLFLGTAESLGGCDNLFTPLGHMAKLYQRKELAGGALPQSAGRFALPLTGGGFTTPTGRFARARRPLLRELAEKALLQQRGLAAALTDERGEILYLHGRSGRYLEPAAGEVGMNILKMAREGLRAPLAAALQAAAVKEEPVRHAGLRVKTNGDFTWVNLAVQQVKDAPEPGARLFLVTLEPASAPAEARAAAAKGTSADTDRRISALNEELRRKEESLEAANAELADYNEELMAANEELQSSNEELQSTNEELSTSTEELQSINEELSTVNAEQQEKVGKLSRANNDIVNLLAVTGIGTIFVDQQLRVQRFTTSVTRVINLIPGDVGRPLAHTVPNLVNYSGLVEDTQAVLDTLQPKDIEVQNKVGEWFLLRLRPYRTVENMIEGATITFVEITELKLAQEAMRRLAVVLFDSRDAVTVQDLDGCILAWNPAAERAYGWSAAEALSMNIRALVPEEQREAALQVARRLSQAETIEPYRAGRVRKDGRLVEAVVTATPLLNEAGKVYAISTTERLIADEKGKGEG